MSEKSAIPVIQEVNDQQHIEMISVRLGKFSIGEREMIIEHSHGGAWMPVKAEVFKLNDHEVGDYLPSKVFVHDGEIYLMFYVNDQLPNAVRPFEDDVCYGWLIDWVPGWRVRYPALSRVFIDQVIVDGRMKILFISDSATYESLLSVPERKIELDGELAMYTSKQHRWA